MNRWMKFVALVLAFSFAIYLTSYISRLPESNCTTRRVSKSWSSDRAYNATLLRKECNLGETAFMMVWQLVQATARVSWVLPLQ